MSKKQYEKFRNAKYVSVPERIYFALRYIKINVKYWWRLYIGHEYDSVPGHKYINKSISEREYSKLMDELYGNQYLENKYDNEEKQMVLKKWLARIIVDILKLEEGGLQPYAMQGQIKAI